jgi:predicted phage terminase large subunit-like protein
MGQYEARGQLQALTLSELTALARADFATFVELAFPILHSNEPLVWAQYIELIAVVLQGCAKGRHRRLLINLPPGFLKSMLVSIFYVAWRLGGNPSAKFICISYGDDLAHYLSMRTRDLMMSALYRKIFPGTVLLKKAEDLITTTKGGYRYATAVGSDIMGFRADDIILDDPLQPDDAVSAVKKQAVIDWIQQSVLSRFKDPTKGVLIAVMQRLAPDDPSGLLEQQGAFSIKLPLIAETPEKYTARGKIIFRRETGDLLNPSRMTIKDVEELKRQIPPHVFISQYQQRPVSSGSGMCTISKLRRYKNAPPFDLKIHSWDIAATPEGNYTVCTKWGAAKVADLGDVVFLTDVVRIRAEIPDVREAIIMHDKLDKPDLIVMDGIGVGLGLYQDLRQRGFLHIFSSRDVSNLSQAKKVERFGKALLYMYDGKVRFPETAPYIDSLFEEFSAFPSGKFDDQVDSVAQLATTMGNCLMFARQKHRPSNL